MTLARQIARGADLAGYSPLLTSDITVGVPSDYPTLQTAINDMMRYNHLYYRITILIEAGHQPGIGFSISGGMNCGHMLILAEDSLVEVDAGFEGRFAFIGDQSVSPKLACLIDQKGLGGDGFHIDAGSKGLINSGAGILNAGDRGLYANGGSSVSAGGCDFSGAKDRGLWITRNSHASVGGGKFNGCNAKGAVNTANSIRRCSTANAQEAEFNDGLNGFGINASRASALNLAGAFVNRNAGGGVQSERLSSVSLEGSGTATVEDNVSDDLAVRWGGLMDATNVQTTNGSPSIDDCNISAFNTPGSNGCIFV